ncbi:hypothetical protein V2J09_016471 [Rumex salicifolius]
MSECLGLPCIHRIVIAMVHKKTILLSEIHIFWRQVTWEGLFDAEGDNTIIPPSTDDVTLQEFTERFLSGQMKEDDKFQMADLYHTINNPKRTLLKEPNHVKNRGRPSCSTGFKFSMKRKPIFVERVKEQYSESGSQKKNKKENFPIRRKVSVENQKNEVILGPPYVDTIMLSFILSTQIVLDDGNCGYRSLALLFDLQEDEYRVVYKEITQELEENETMYQPMCAWLNEDALIPPPLGAWKRYRNEDIVGWENFFSNRIDTWRRFRMQAGHHPDSFV